MCWNSSAVPQKRAAEAGEQRGGAQVEIGCSCKHGLEHSIVSWPPKYHSLSQVGWRTAATGKNRQHPTGPNKGGSPAFWVALEAGRGHGSLHIPALHVPLQLPPRVQLLLTDEHLRSIRGNKECVLSTGLVLQPALCEAPAG